MTHKKEKYFLLILILILFIINYPLLDSLTIKFLDNTQTIKIQRVVDGDTVIINNQSTRLLGINTPERGELYYAEAKKFLENLTQNKTLTIKKQGTDRYNRTLAYLFLDNKNINLELVKQGLANFYFPQGKKEYYFQFKGAWQDCITSQKNLCQKSTNKCATCIKLKELDYKSEVIFFENICSFNCDLTNWQIKDEGRKKFIFPEFTLNSHTEIKIITGQGTNTNENLFWTNEDYVWTDTGDTLFLRDEEGNLVLFNIY
ncbi:MAG: thermonuclease family protein [Candidatus Pacearchaeota archaeon]|nr:thermonuclease family protein [Candidatus Pacearchaeota archaeon]